MKTFYLSLLCTLLLCLGACTKNDSEERPVTEVAVHGQTYHPNVDAQLIHFYISGKTGNMFRGSVINLLFRTGDTSYSCLIALENKTKKVKPGTYSAGYSYLTIPGIQPGQSTARYNRGVISFYDEHTRQISLSYEADFGNGKILTMKLNGLVLKETSVLDQEAHPDSF